MAGERVIPRQLSAADINLRETGRVVATVDDSALEGRREPPLRADFEHRYGKEGIGWLAVNVKPSNWAEKFAREVMELRVLRIVVTPEGDAFAEQHPPR